MGKSLVLGFFDGVHKAHRAVIESALNCSGDVTLITFKDSPAVYFGNKAEYILSRKNSIKKIKDLGVKDVVELDFPQIASLSAEDYLKNLIKEYHPVSISTGFNHTFGLNKTGNPNFLEREQDRYNYKYICTPPVVEDGEIVSSTLIRDFLMKGEAEKANKLLESNFILEGTVVHGAKIGRTLGFPTANIKYAENIVKLPFGVYKSTVKISEKDYLPAVINWGMKPTLNNTAEPIVEVHILGFDGDLYGKNIRAELIKKIRGEKKFNGLDELKAQIKEDIKKCSEL